MTARLSRDAIIAAALELADTDGVERLSIRRVAARLGVTPMALYKYFDNKDELLSFALEAFVARADVIPEAGLPWDEWVEQVGQRMYAALCSDFSWVPILGSVRVGAEATKVTDAFVTRLTDAGFTDGQAVQAYYAVIQVVLGAVCLQSSLAASRRAADGELSAATRAYLEQPDLERLRVAPELDRVARMEQIDIGLPMVVAALRQQLADRV